MSYKFKDQVWLSGRNIKTTRLAKKLNYKYYEFFTIRKFVGSHTYNLELPSTFYNIYNIFYISFFKFYQTTKGQALFFLLLIELKD